MAITSRLLLQFKAEARPVIERQLADADIIAAMREAFTAQGGDWGSLKALIKAEVQDDQGEGERKKLRKVIDRSATTVEYAELLNMNEENFIREAAE